MTTTHQPRTRGARRRLGALLPEQDPLRLLDEQGRRVPSSRDLPEPSTEMLHEMLRQMIIGRRLDAQCTALTKQGRLAVYPSSRGQEACQVAPALALRATDWIFPTYRESVALFARGIDPVQALTLLRGDWHCGYDPVATRTAPQCTPLATQTIHAAGLAYGEAHQGRDTVALAFVGDGATSEGDFHEALNFAAVFRAPVIFFVQNNRYAISVPLARQTAAPSLAYKGVGYGVASEQVDGNDPLAVLALLTAAVEYARSGRGPFLIEAHTYRMEAHTNADDPSRYRDSAEVDAWSSRDPIARLEAYLRGTGTPAGAGAGAGAGSGSGVGATGGAVIAGARASGGAGATAGALDDAALARIRDEAERAAADLRTRMNAEPVVAASSLFEHVFATPTPQLVEQRDQVSAELAARADENDRVST